MPIGQVFFVPREDVTFLDCTEEELEALKKSDEEFGKAKAAAQVTTPYGIPTVRTTSVRAAPRSHNVCDADRGGFVSGRIARWRSACCVYRAGSCVGSSCRLPFAVMSVAAVAQPESAPEYRVAPVVLTSESYTFDTAEQHKIRVVVVAKGLVHPFSLAMLPNGDALVTERGVRLRIVRNATGRGATLDHRGGGRRAADRRRSAGGGACLDVCPAPEVRDEWSRSSPTTRPTPVAATPRSSRRRSRLAAGDSTGRPSRSCRKSSPANSRPGRAARGSRFSPDGLLYMTTGAPFGQEAQTGNSVYGKSAPPARRWNGSAG